MLVLETKVQFSLFNSEMLFEYLFRWLRIALVFPQLDYTGRFSNIFADQISSPIVQESNQVEWFVFVHIVFIDNFLSHLPRHTSSS